MVFDGEHLTPFDEELLADLRRGQLPAVGPDGPGLPGSTPPRGGRPGRRLAASAVVAFVVLVAGITVAAVAARPTKDDQAEVDQTPGPDATPDDVGDADSKADKAAGALVAAAIVRTTAANSFHIAYRLESTPPTIPPTTTEECKFVTLTPSWTLADGSTENQAQVEARIESQLEQLKGKQVCLKPGVLSSSTTGEGTITIDPKTMDVSALLNSGLSVNLQLRGDQIRESGGDTSGPTQSLSSFAGLVQSSIGMRAGALGMTRMASPNGYLALEEGSVDRAKPGGTDTVDGVAVTNYDVTVELSQLLTVAGLTEDERNTIQAALKVLDDEGHTGTTVRVSIDEAGFIRHLHYVATFSDGGTVVFDAAYSNFGCGTAAAPTPCESTAPTTTSTAPSESTTTAAPTTPPPSTSTSTSTVPSSTTTAPSSTSTSAPASTTTASAAPFGTR